MKVFVYFNLHRKCFSIKALEGDNKGRVIAHADKVYLSDATFKVSQAGRERVIREKRKNVHAGVVGHWEKDFQSFNDVSVDLLREIGKPITYNPYKYETFVSVYGQIPQHKSRRVGLFATESVTGERRGFIYSADY